MALEYNKVRPHAITFDQTVCTHVAALVFELYGVPAAHDFRLFLYDRLDGVSRVGLTALANRAEMPVWLIPYDQGNSVRLDTGETFQVTRNGWLRTQGK